MTDPGRDDRLARLTLEQLWRSHVAAQRRNGLEVSAGLEAAVVRRLDVLVPPGTASVRQEPPPVAGSVDGVDDPPLHGVLLPLDRVAGLLAVGRRTVERLASSGELVTVKVAGRRLVHRADLESYAEQLRTTNGA